MKKNSIKEPAPIKPGAAAGSASKLPVGQKGQPPNPLVSPSNDKEQQRKSILAAELKKKEEEEQRQKQELKMRIVVLPTGLEMLFTSEAVKRIWEYTKPKVRLIEFIISDVLKRKAIEKNFESMELNIIVEFHLYNLIFAKQRLFLSDQHAAIFLNLMWTLLINNNKDYGALNESYLKASRQFGEGFPKEVATALLANHIEQNSKSLESDSVIFKRWLTKHSYEHPPHCVQMFTTKQAESIVDFAKEAYFSHYSLYRFCLNNKKRSEEILINLYIDKPFEIPPLSEALYMGKQRLEIPDEDDDDPVAKDLEMQQARLEKQRELERKEEEARMLRNLDPTVDILENTKQFVDARLQTVKDSFTHSIQQRQEAMHQRFDEIVNPKKKK